MYQDDNEYINEAQGYTYDIKNTITGASQEQKRDVVRSALHHERALHEQTVNPPRRLNLRTELGKQIIVGESLDSEIFI